MYGLSLVVPVESHEEAEGCRKKCWEVSLDLVATVEGHPDVHDALLLLLLCHQGAYLNLSILWCSLPTRVQPTTSRTHCIRHGPQAERPLTRWHLIPSDKTLKLGYHPQHAKRVVSGWVSPANMWAAVLLCPSCFCFRVCRAVVACSGCSSKIAICKLSS